MPALSTDKLDQVSSSNSGRPVVSQLTGGGHSIAGTSVTINDATNWTTNSKIHFVIYTLTTIGGVSVKDATSQTEWEGTLVGTTISNMVLTGGTDRAYSAGAIIEIAPTSKYAKDLYDWGTAQHNQDGTHKNITSTNATITNLTTTNLTITGSNPTGGLTPLGQNPSTITYLGNRSYQLVYSGVDLTGTLSPGMRQSFVRTVTAPTQCTSLNGTNQYYSKTSPAGMTFTDDFVVSAWVKLTSYASAGIVTRYNGTSGWRFAMDSSGRISLEGYNGAGANISYVQTYQSIPLNKWVHIAAQLDMSTFTASSTTSFVMIDGVDVPAQALRGGTNPTALIQAGNLEIGSSNATQFFPGKIAQVAIYSAKVTQANIRATISQGLAGTETSLISAYSFNNSINDLNTTNANNLTANNGATATNADSPFSLNSFGTPTGNTDFGIVQASTFSTNTTTIVQVPEGNTIPTTGGITTTYYSHDKAPYGMPSERGKWQITAFYVQQLDSGMLAIGATGAITGVRITAPANSSFKLGYEINGQQNPTAGNTVDVAFGLSTATTPINLIETVSKYSLSGSSAMLAGGCLMYRTTDIQTTTETNYLLVSKNHLGATATSYINTNTPNSAKLFLENAYL